jgi:glucose/arabinose dehydrogenase
MAIPKRRMAAIMTAKIFPITRPVTALKRPQLGGTRQSRRAALPFMAVIFFPNGKIRSSSGRLAPMDARIREVETAPDGAIWLLEDGAKGRLLKLTPKKQP